MLQIKIHGATPKGGKSICLSCKNSTIVKGQNCQEIIMCGVFSNAGRGQVPFKVSECGSYHPVNMPWLHEMEEMAWKIEARKRGPVGFNDPTCREEGEMEVVITRPKNSNVSTASND